MGPRRQLLLAALLLGWAGVSGAEDPLDEFLGDDFNASDVVRPGHLPPEADWQFELAPHIRRRAISHGGSMNGVRRLVKRCISRQPIKFGVVGGSISTGHGMAQECHGPEYLGSYSRLVYDWLNAACPHPDNAYLNGALAATGSMHFSQCLWQSVPKNLDVILIEFAVNEGGNPHCDASMELIVRRLLIHNPAITIIIVNWHDHWPLDEFDARVPNWEPFVKGHSEEGFTHIGMWYDTVVISARTAFLPEMLAETPGFKLRDFNYNWNHPNTQGHRWLAELIVRSPTSLSLLQVSMLREEIVRRHALVPPPPPLMPPFIAGNDEEAATEAGCVFGTQFEGFAREHEGWEFKQTKHWGWETPGTGDNVLLLDIGQVFDYAMLTYLVSGKRELGTAHVTCEGSCACEAMDLAAKTEHPIQVRFQKRIKTTPGRDCRLRIRVTGGYFQMMGFVKWPRGTKSLDGALGETFPYEYRARESLHALMANVTW